jgi:hypothetical protein
MKNKNKIIRAIIAYTCGFIVALIFAIIGRILFEDQYFSGWFGAAIFIFIINKFEEKNESTASIIKKLSKKLEDPAYFQGWRDNIAMSYHDNERWYCETTNIKVEDLDNEDKRIIANNAAEHFINQLTK